MRVGRIGRCVVAYLQCVGLRWECEQCLASSSRDNELVRGVDQRDIAGEGPHTHDTEASCSLHYVVESVVPTPRTEYVPIGGQHTPVAKLIWKHGVDLITTKLGP